MKVLNRNVIVHIQGPPQKDRKTFNIYLGEQSKQTTPKRRKYTNIKHTSDLAQFYDALTAINISLKSGKIKAAQARVEVENIKSQIEEHLEKKNPKQTYSHYNLKVLERFIAEDINVRRITEESRISAQNRVAKAIHKLGNKSLRTITRATLQSIANEIESDNKAIVNIYNRLLTFLSRTGMKIYPLKEEKGRVPHLSEKQVLTLIKSIPASKFKTLPLIDVVIMLSFELGTRISETLALDSNCIDEQDGVLVVKVYKHLARPAKGQEPLIRDYTKNKKNRTVLPLNEKRTAEALTKWINAGLSNKERAKYFYEPSKLVKSLAQDLFKIRDSKDRKEVIAKLLPGIKQVGEEINEDQEFRGIHMLRASHARHLIDEGASLDDVAWQLGDHIFTTQKYYAGFVHSKSTIQRLAKIRSGSKKRKQKRSA